MQAVTQSPKHFYMKSIQKLSINIQNIQNIRNTTSNLYTNLCCNKCCNNIHAILINNIHAILINNIHAILTNSRRYSCSDQKSHFKDIFSIPEQSLTGHLLPGIHSPII